MWVCLRAFRVFCLLFLLSSCSEEGEDIAREDNLIEIKFATDWKAQAAYTTPNFGGFEATGAITEGTGQVDNSNLGYEGKASYSFAGDAVSGKFWVGGKTLKIQTSAVAGAGNTVGTGAITEFDARGGEGGAKFSAAGFCKTRDKKV